MAINKFLKNSSIKAAAMIEESKVFKERELAPTQVYALNIAYSGSLFGGLDTGLTLWAGPSRHFKSVYTLISVKAWMDKYPDAICLFYDSEFGTPSAYFKSVGIDTSRVVHLPVTNIEDLKFDVMKQLDIIDETDKVIIAIDSIGNTASVKEVQDALDEKSVADMSRAKALKGFTRMITPILKTKDIPCIGVNHTYQEIGMFPKTIMGGGTGLMYSADQVFFVGRSQEKEGSEIAGYTFTINIEKSRHVKEKSKIGITVKHEGGLDIYSGLLDIAMDTGFIRKPSNGWYSRVLNGELEDRKWRAKDTSCKDFWDPLIYDDPGFEEAINKKYKVANADLLKKEPEEMSDEELMDELD